MTEKDETRKERKQALDVNTVYITTTHKQQQNSSLLTGVGAVLSHVNPSQYLLLDSVPAIEDGARACEGPHIGDRHPRTHPGLRSHNGGHMIVTIDLVARSVVELLRVVDEVLGDIQRNDHLIVTATPNAPLGVARESHRDSGGAQNGKRLGEF